MKIRSTFLLNFFSLNAVSITIKVLNFLFFIFLVRELSLKEYGVYALVWTQVNFFTPLLDFGTTSYGLVYMDAERKEKLNALFTFRFVIGLAVFIITLISGFFYLHEKSISNYIFLTSFAIFTNVMYGSFVILMSLRQKAYISSMYSLVFMMLLVSMSSLALIITKSLFFVFLVVFIMYNVNTLFSWIFIKFIHHEFTFSFKPDIWREIVSKSYVFVLISFFLGIYFKIDVFLLKFLKSNLEVGIYSAGYKFFESLLFLLGSYTIAATPRLVKLYKESKDSFLSKVRKDSIFLSIFGIFIAICTFFVAPLLLTYVLKQNAASAVHVLQIVIVALPFMLLSTIYTNALYVIDRARSIILVYTFQIALNLILNLIFIPRYSYIASSYITVLNEVINVVILFSLFHYFLKRGYNKS